MLIRQKITNLNDEYHHVDPVGMFGVLTDASGNVLRNYVYDAFSDAPYKRQYVGESFPSQSNHTGTCQTALSEPGIITGNGGQGVVVPSRGFQVMGKKPKPAKKHPCSDHYDKNILCILFGIDCPKKSIKEPKSCTDSNGVSLCEQCLSDLYRECIKQSGMILKCHVILRGCQGRCHEGVGNGKDIYDCWKKGMAA